MCQHETDPRSSTLFSGTMQSRELGGFVGSFGFVRWIEATSGVKESLKHGLRSGSWDMTSWKAAAIPYKEGSDNWVWTFPWKEVTWFLSSSLVFVPPEYLQVLPEPQGNRVHYTGQLGLATVTTVNGPPGCSDSSSSFLGLIPSALSRWRQLEHGRLGKYLYFCFLCCGFWYCLPKVKWRRETHFFSLCDLVDHKLDPKI